IVTAASPTTGASAAETIVPPGSSWDASENYQGAVTGWWEGTPTGNARVTELV
ncbi:MAG: hypothetical protein IAI49_13985, partial [Candidatus Eremiobacteraeota bacterium]|nr:hypothetical protein [Candidatus Eremiobacteraeota bacterium]